MECRRCQQAETGQKKSQSTYEMMYRRSASLHFQDVLRRPGCLRHFSHLLKSEIMFARHGNHLTSRRPDVCWHSKPQHRFSSCRQSRCSSLPVQSRIRARWCIDIKYGVKLDAVALLSEWVQNIGSQAGLSDNVHILSGAVGVPESRIEVLQSYPSLTAAPKASLSGSAG